MADSEGLEVDDRSLFPVLQSVKSMRVRYRWRTAISTVMHDNNQRASSTDSPRMMRASGEREEEEGPDEASNNVMMGAAMEASVSPIRGRAMSPVSWNSAAFTPSDSFHELNESLQSDQPSSLPLEDTPPPGDLRFVDYFAAFAVEPDPLSPVWAAGSQQQLSVDPATLEGAHLSLKSTRFPFEDHSDFSFPKGLDIFALGPGPRVCSEDGLQQLRQEPRSPCFFTVVLTDDVGQRTYASCVHFYEKSGDRGLYFARAFCLLSHYPFVTTLRKCITELFRMHGRLVPQHRSEPSIAQVLVMLTQEIFLPVPGGPSVRFKVGLIV